MTLAKLDETKETQTGKTPNNASASRSKKKKWDGGWVRK